MISRIYQYGNTFKLVVFKKGIPKGIDYDKETEEQSNDEKLANNIARARAKILEYGLCNEWEYFVTLTLNGAKQDRYDLESYVKRLGEWVSNYNKKFGCKLKYILIPEKHKDGAWHMHGLWHDVAAESLIINQHGYYDMPYYANRFGYISFSSIKSLDRVSKYITKYVSKDVTDRAGDLGKHLYYASRGLQGKTCVGEFNAREIPKGAYNGDYCAVLWSDNIEKLIAENRLESINV